MSDPEERVLSRNVPLVLNRGALLTKIVLYLDREATWDEVYQWAFNSALDNSFAHVTESDPLFHAIILDLIQLNSHATSPVLLRRFLSDCALCLEGEKDYKPLQEKLSLPRRIGYFLEELALNVLLCVLRLYVAAFAFCSLVINALLISNPGFFSGPNAVLSPFSFLKPVLPPLYSFIREAVYNQRIGILINAVLPRHELFQVHALHIAFAFLAIIPPVLILRSVILPVALPFMWLALFYYWYMTWDISRKVVYIFTLPVSTAYFIVFCFIALPATLALVQLVIKGLYIQTKKES